MKKKKQISGKTQIVLKHVEVFEWFEKRTDGVCKLWPQKMAYLTKKPTFVDLFAFLIRRTNTTK